MSELELLEFEQVTASKTSSGPPGDAQLTPMMRQYWDVKTQRPDCLLFFRLGDFYEMFDEDAHVGARELDITLTGRPESSYPGGRVPMAGVPVKSVDLYLAKLLDKGYSVAICEQVGVVGAGKGPVERQVTKVLTPGTVLESTLLPARESNYLVALLTSKAAAATASGAKRPLWGLAYVDASSGEFALTELAEDKVKGELARLSPREVLVAKRSRPPSGDQLVATEVLDAPDGVAALYRLTGRPAMFFQPEPGRRRLMQAFNVSTLEGFGCQDKELATGAAGAILEYLEATQGGQLPKLTGAYTYCVDDHLIMDDTSRRNLEITETVRERALEGSLLSVLDKTQTAMGGRLLRNWLSRPLTSVAEIALRQDAVAELVETGDLRQELRSQLPGLADLERMSMRLASGTISPRDLAAVAATVLAVPAVAAACAMCTSSYLNVFAMVAPELIEIGERLQAILVDEPPRELTAGGIFRAGYSAELDEVNDLLTGGKNWIEEFQRKEQERTNIRSLKVGFNNNFGYFIEVTHANKSLVPDDYIRKQTLTNAERFITPDLKEYEAKVLNAEKAQKDLEYKLFTKLRSELVHHGDALSELARALARLDVFVCLAQIASEQKYVRPIVDNSHVLEIKGGRHPVLEKILPRGRFVPNDTFLEAGGQREQTIILTGPNMSGKSSLLRQVAQIVILAQLGSFVPADACRVGIVDRIFTRIGAVDDLTQGQSTFLVEMSETTQCCVSATRRSLILLDEVGRGTSTYDGVAIAWSVAEYLATQVCARTIFATHYHELNGLANYYQQVANWQVKVLESEGQVEFLHKVIPGGASRSFGIHVASMAGLPAEIIARANTLMNQMERKSAAAKILEGPKLRSLALDEVMQLSLFQPRA